MRELMGYLPENYRQSPEMTAFQEALQPELDALWRARDDLLAQLDLNTATWGLALWEEALGISGSARIDAPRRMDWSEAERRPAQRAGDQAESEGAVCQWHTPSADRAERRDSRREERVQSERDNANLELRRRQVAAKLRGLGTTTPEAARAVAETALGVPVEVVEHFGAYQVELTLDSGGNVPTGLAAVEKLLAELMPAHLDWYFVIPLPLGLSVSTGLGVRASETALPLYRRALGPAAMAVTAGPSGHMSTTALPNTAGAEGG